jgi:hypothetical protein
MLRPAHLLNRSLAALLPALFAAFLLAPAAAWAQMAQGPPTPLAVDLAKVPIGSWAKYNMTMGTMPPMSMKMALVARTSTGNTLESSMEGGLAAKAGKVVSQMVLGPGSEGTVSKMVLQVGGNDPMEMPIQAAQGKQFSKPDPKTFVKEETVKVAGGSFKTKHYHDKSAQGDTVDYWVSENVAPLGLVKIEMTQKSNPMISGPIKMELTGTGKDAKMVITKKPKPFDQNELVKQMTGGAGAAPAAAPPAAKK